MNLLKVIRHYTESLRVFTRGMYPYRWATMTAGVGAAHEELSGGNNKDYLRKAIENYQATLQVFTKEEYPEDWEDTINKLNLLKRKLLACEKTL